MRDPTGKCIHIALQLSDNVFLNIAKKRGSAAPQALVRHMLRSNKHIYCYASEIRFSLKLIFLREVDPS